jgi:hypothetical protein
VLTLCRRQFVASVSKGHTASINGAEMRKVKKITYLHTAQVMGTSQLESKIRRGEMLPCLGQWKKDLCRLKK